MLSIDYCTNGLEKKSNETDLFHLIQLKEKQILIYKVLYQTSELDNPRREFTNSLYMDAASSIEVRQAVEKNTDYEIEFIQELDEKHLEYEKKSPDFKLTEF